MIQKFVNQFHIFCAVVLLCVGCNILASGDMLVLEPSPVNLLVGAAPAEQPSILVTLLLRESKQEIAHVWLDAVASAKFGTQTLAAKEEMSRVGRSREGYWVYQWEIPGYLLDAGELEDTSQNHIQWFVRVEDGAGKIHRLEGGTDIYRTAYSIEPSVDVAGLAAVDAGGITWSVLGDLPADSTSYRLLFCRESPSQIGWSEKGCKALSLVKQTVLAGHLTTEPLPVLAKGQWWWVIQAIDRNNNVAYQSQPGMLLVDPAGGQWIGIALTGSGLSHSLQSSAANGYHWYIYRDGVLIMEEPLSSGPAWEIDGLVMLPGYYEIIVMEAESGAERSNLLAFVVKDSGQAVSLQEEFALTDDDTAMLWGILDDLMTLPPDEVEYFITRMAFQGVVDAEGLRAVLRETGFSDQDLLLMAERGQVDELGRLFALAYQREVFSLNALREGLDVYLGEP